MNDHEHMGHVESKTRVEEGFSKPAMMAIVETASAAVAAQAQAAVQARYVMAYKRPRDLDEVRVRLMKECKRPSFADVARYHKPIGRGVEGPSIRFAEVAIRCMTNILPETQAIFDSPEKRIIKVSVTDLEANVTYSQDIVVDKTVERSKVSDGQQAISMRTNSQGKITYLVAATEDDLLNKQNALISKGIRSLALRLVPGDLIDEAMDAVLATQKDRDARDPDAARKKLVDGFVSMGVKPGDLKTYLGHDLETVSPPELAHLRALFAAMRDGETNWKDALEARTKKSADGKAPESLKERARAKAAEAAKASAPVAPPTSAPREPGSDDDEMTDEDLAEARRVDAGYLG